MRIVSDGTVEGTKVFDSNGDQVPYVQAVYFLCGVDQIPTALIKVVNIPVDFTVDENEVVTVNVPLQDAVKEEVEQESCTE